MSGPLRGGERILGTESEMAILLVGFQTQISFLLVVSVLLVCICSSFDVCVRARAHARAPFVFFVGLFPFQATFS